MRDTVLQVEESGSNKAHLNKTAVLAAWASQLDSWFEWRCREIEQLLEKPLRRLKGEPCPVVGCPKIVGKVNDKLQNLGKAALAHMVDRSEFWKMPGSIATLTERKNEARGQQCLAALEARGRRHGLNLTGLLTLTVPAAAPSHTTEASAAAQAAAQEAAVAADSSRASRRNSTAGEVTVDLRALEMALDAAVDETAGALKASARRAAATMAARSKGKKKAPRPDRIARRALAQALKSKGGPCSEEGESDEQPSRHAKGHVKARGSPSDVMPEEREEEPRAKGGHGKKRRGKKGKGGRGTGVKNSPETFFKKD